MQVANVNHDGEAAYGESMQIAKCWEGVIDELLRIIPKTERRIKSMKKRVFSFVLVMTMLLSLLPIQITATDFVTSNEEVGVSGILTENIENSFETNSNDGVSDYRKWAQGDSRWGSIKLGSSSYTMSSSGCLVVAITKTIIQAGLKNAESFTPATMVNWLNSNSGFDANGNLYWAKPATYSGMTNQGNLVSYGSYSSSGNNDKIISWINQGYHIVLNVNNGGHWIAIDEAKTLATGKVYIMDSLYSSANADIALADRYSTFNLAHAYKGGKTASPTCTITFDANGGSCGTSTKTVTAGSAIGTLPTPTRDGYDFAGWYGSVYSGGDPINSSTTVSADTTYYALWANCVYDGDKITFDTQGGMLPDATNTLEVTSFNAARGAGHVVIYNCISPKVATNYWGMEIAVDATGKIIAKRDYEVSDQLTVPAGGFVFSMHSTATNSWEFYDNADIGEYLGYYTSNGTTYVSHYDSCSAYLKNHTYLNNGDEYGCLPLPSRDGYLFHGWFTAAPDSEWGSEVTWDSGYCADTLYAHWVETDSVDPAAVAVDTDNDRRYELYDQVMTWTDAKAFCESLGGHLVTITSEDEQELIVDELLADGRRSQYYIGATDEQEEGSWVWITGESFGYSNWDQDQSEPTGYAGENYGSIIAETHSPYKGIGEWNDMHNEDHNANDPFYDVCNTGFICEFENICDHNYTTTRVDATCVDYGYTIYTCQSCGDTYTVFDGDYTEWSTTKPSGVDEGLIETKTQYRYADKETTTSYEPSLSGWTKISGEWQQSGSGSIQYVKSWPSGFLTSHSLYSTYNKSAKSATETETDKTVINSDKVSGYLYYHWCRGTYTAGPINRAAKSTKQGEFATFHAFYSTTAPSSLTSAPDNDGSYQYANGSCCKDTYWYYYTPVYTQNYTTYRNLFTYERWSDWSDWSDTVYTSSSTRKIETRTMYRAAIGQLGEHTWDNGVVTKEPTATAEGEMTYTCQVCGATRTEAIAKTGNPFVDVPESSFFYKPVLWALENGITAGLDDTHFGPDAACTRAQVVTFLWSAAGKPEPVTTVNPFEDVSGTNYFYKPVLWAYENGITSGVDATHFGSGAVCTREQVVTFLWSSKGKPASSTAVTFTDVQPGAYFYNAVAWAVENKVTSGMGDGTFGAGKTCTRAQVVTFLYAVR